MTGTATAQATYPFEYTEIITTKPLVTTTTNTPLLPITHMSNAQLAERCLQEMRRYRENQEHDDQYCLELFHRAVIAGDQDAWEVLQTSFTPIMHGWLRRHPKREVACRLDSEENYIAMAFVRFWQATVHNQRVEFHSLAGAMRYLQASLNGAIMDALRAYARPREIPLPDPGFADEPMVEDEDELCSSLEAINTLLTSPVERRIAYLLFYCGLKPRDIVKHCPLEFPTVRDVYRLRRNIMEKLQRNIQALRWQLV